MAHGQEPIIHPEALQAFREHFGDPPASHLSRAPGRVNLIGEHTDYNGLPVFPMALRREVRLLFRPRSHRRMRVVNADSAFGDEAFELSRDIPPGPPGSWGNYLRAPCQALVRHFGDLRGVDAHVSSTLPVASGLSSSSALVIAMARALMHANDLELPTLELAEAMARAEQYTGTRGGGMDQAISLGARVGHASRIEFDPLQLHESRVPGHWRFVVAHTLLRAEKSGASQAAYNRRRQECEGALETIRTVLAREGGHGGAHASVSSYSDLLTRIPVGDLVDLASRHLPQVLFRRFRHVVREALRVYEAEEAMRRGDVLTFGLLMDASHESLREDYEVSSPELDRLVDLARRGGAAGARLTGAGFGGCVVALTDRRHLDQVLGTLEDRYFRSRLSEGERLDDVLFVAEAGGGASVQEI